MNKYSKLSKEQMLKVCEIIHPDTEWAFFQILDNDGKGTDDCYEFTATDESIAQFNIHQSEDDEMRFYPQGDIDCEFYSEINNPDYVEFKKITEFLNSVNKPSKSSNTKSITNEKAEISDSEIKNKYVEVVGVDKFTKVEEYKLAKTIDLDKKILSDYADAQAGVSSLNPELENISAKLNRSNFFLHLGLTYRKKAGQDIFILEINLNQINLAGYDFMVNGLKEGQILFLFDDDETITLNNIIKYNPGTSEELFLETDVSILTKIINSKTIEYRLQGARGVISESIFSKNDQMAFVGFYNALFDSTFRRKEIDSLFSTVKAKKKVESKKKVEAKKPNKKQTNTSKNSSSCFVVTATMNDSNHPVVNDFRMYRNKYLETNKLGNVFIKLYYLIGPHLANLIKKNPSLKKISYHYFIKPIHRYIQKKNDSDKN